MDTQAGTKAICSQCGKEIIFIGPYWDHPGEIKPRHPAFPVDEAPLQPLQPWWALLSPREQATIAHARAYAQNFPDAGVPGHSQFLLISKLSHMIDELAPKGTT